MSTESDLELDIVVATTSLIISKKRRTHKPKRKYRIHPYLTERGTKGRFTKMTYLHIRSLSNRTSVPPLFQELLQAIGPLIEPRKHSRPDSISSQEKLCITLEFLASGTLQRHMGSVYRVSSPAMGQVIESTCDAIYQALKHMFPVASQETWVDVANNFNQKWNLPNCLGSIDGKHIAIKCPNNAGSLFYNYKGFHSIVLMAVTDADYRFLYFDAGAYGSEGDSTVFRESEFGKKIATEDFKFPTDASLMGQRIPFYFVADDAFPLHKRIMKPYCPRDKATLSNPQRIFNYRLKMPSAFYLRVGYVLHGHCL